MRMAAFTPDDSDRSRQFDAHWRRLLADPSSRPARARRRRDRGRRRPLVRGPTRPRSPTGSIGRTGAAASRPARCGSSSTPCTSARCGCAWRPTTPLDRGAREARLRAGRYRGELRERPRHRDRGARLPARVAGASHARVAAAVDPGAAGGVALREIAVRHEVLATVERRTGEAVAGLGGGGEGPWRGCDGVAAVRLEHRDHRTSDSSHRRLLLIIIIIGFVVAVSSFWW